MPCAASGSTTGWDNIANGDVGIVGYLQRVVNGSWGLYFLWFIPCPEKKEPTKQKNLKSRNISLIIFILVPPKWVSAVQKQPKKEKERKIKLPGRKKKQSQKQLCLSLVVWAEAIGQIQVVVPPKDEVKLFFCLLIRYKSRRSHPAPDIETSRRWHRDQEGCPRGDRDAAACIFGGHRCAPGQLSYSSCWSLQMLLKSLGNWAAHAVQPTPRCDSGFAQNVIVWHWAWTEKWLNPKELIHHHRVAPICMCGAPVTFAEGATRSFGCCPAEEVPDIWGTQLWTGGIGQKQHNKYRKTWTSGISHISRSWVVSIGIPSVSTPGGAQGQVGWVLGCPIWWAPSPWQGLGLDDLYGPVQLNDPRILWSYLNLST